MTSPFFFFQGTLSSDGLLDWLRADILQGAGESSGAYTAENNGGFSAYIVLLQIFLLSSDASPVNLVYYWNVFSATKEPGCAPAWELSPVSAVGS